MNTTTESINPRVRYVGGGWHTQPPRYLTLEYTPRVPPSWMYESDLRTDLQPMFTPSVMPAEGEK